MDENDGMVAGEHHVWLAGQVFLMQPIAVT